MSSLLGTVASGATQATPLSAYETLVVGGGPVAFWPLTETSGGIARDISGYGRNGTYTSVSLANRDLGTALGLVGDFNGSSSHVDIAPLPDVPTRSLEAWTIIDTIVNGAGLISEIFTGGGNNVQLEIGLDIVGFSPDQLTISQYPPWVWAATEVTADTGVLTHVVGTNDGSMMRLYVNGSLACLTAAGPIITTDDGWIIGRRHDASGTPFWDGAIGYVAVYDRELSAGEISAHYAAGTA